MDSAVAPEGLVVEWLNYHHLLYFWMVAREGSVTRASAELRLAQPTVSTQIHLLEQALGEKLFVRSGRHLALTDVGREVYRYADEIFALGRELLDVVRQRSSGRVMRLSVGVADVLPKLVVYRLLEPVRKLAQPVHIVCREGKPEPLLAELALHKLDLLLVDTPVGATTSVKAFHHLLGECGITFFAAPALAARFRRRFPASLRGAPMLLPAEGTVLRRSLEQWFESTGHRPQIVSEFEDGALLKAFGQAGAGVFPAPSVIEAEVRRQYGVGVVGRVDAVRERFYAVSHERRLKHPAVVAVCEAAREKLFG
ncbi:MAG: transcriptional activator NhaR [Thermodesulfobacteriota bacterium]